jgi:hypothetical protein
LLVVTGLWLVFLQLWFTPSVAGTAEPLVARFLHDWERPRRFGAEEEAELERANPEWVLMSRMFTALAFANVAARDPDTRTRYIDAIERIVKLTIAEAERGDGPYPFLLPYAKRKPYLDPTGRSLFVDGEIALMLAALENVDRRPKASRDPALDAEVWVTRVREQIERGPALLGESYPNEAWIFCNTAALAAIRLHDVATGARHAHDDLFARWVENARANLVDKRTGLLVSATHYDGVAWQGPEGSTIWFAAEMLLLVDESFAREQYALARKELGRSFLGFAWSREWSAAEPARDDIDSGPTVPFVGANAGASGLAIGGAKAFGDKPFLEGLLASLQLTGFPMDGRSRYAAGNLMADAAFAYGTTTGPLWAITGFGGSSI